MIYNDKLPLVTIIAACYNQEKFVVEALESIKAQTYLNIELIIWDDCSKDNSVKLIENWIEENNIVCRFLKHTENKGICKSLNEAISFAKGKYLQLIALDDIILPDKITKHVELIEQLGEDFAFVFSDVYIINEKGELTNETFHTKYFGEFVSTNNINYFEVLLNGNIIHGLSAIYRTEIIKLIGGYDETLYAEDWDMHIRLSLHSKIYFDSSYISAKYRILQTSANNDPNKRIIALNSSCRSFKKFLGNGIATDKLIFNKIESFAKELKYKGSNDWKKWYRFLFYKNPNAGTLKLFLYSIVKK